MVRTGTSDRPSRRGLDRYRRRPVLAAALAAAWVAALNLDCDGPPPDTAVDLFEAPPRVDDDLELARRYAPFLYHAVHPERGRQDLPAPVDFDGDLSGTGNWDALERWRLLPTVYYAVLETETHLFLTYHVFHPRDWAFVRVGVHLTHENDGENLQVVVAKASDEVVLLFTQAHYRGRAHARPGSGFGAALEDLDEALLLVDDEGLPSRAGRHAAVFVESRGHGIESVVDRPGDVTVRPDGRADFSPAGLVFRPARPGEAVREPALNATTPVPYRLESTTAKLWPGVADGTLVGEDRLLDGALPLTTGEGEVDVPRYYEGDRFSGPFGPDRGISPFAVDFGFGRGAVGWLFFDPARRYADVLVVPQPWSTTYVDYPFTR